jgi:hypothetical protein
VQVTLQTAMMLGDFVSSIQKMFSSMEQVIIHFSTTTIAVSILHSFLAEMITIAVKLMLIIRIATCSAGGGLEDCQLNIIDLEGTLTNINIYCLSTVGTTNMISEAGNSLALYSANVNVYPDNIALFKLAAGSGGSGT